MRKPNLMDLYVLYSNTKPSLIDFEDFSIYEACTKKYEDYAQSILKLNSIFISGRVTMRVAKNLIEPLLDEENDAYNSPTIDLNLDNFTNKISDLKIKPIPSCLASNLGGDDPRKGNKTDDILNPNNKKLNSTNDSTEKASSALQKASDKMSLENKAFHIEENLDSIMATIIDQKYLKLFLALDMFQNYINKTSFVKHYKEFRDFYDCIDKNCKELKKYTPDDYFLWSDEEKTKFILPIDINDGKLRIAKFSDILSDSQKIQAKKIELLYYNYVEKRVEIIKKAYEKVKSNNIDDVNNPFYPLLKKEDPTKVINTLF